MTSETVECPLCDTSTVVILDDDVRVVGTTPSRTVVGIFPKSNLVPANCPGGHRFYVEYSKTGR